MYAGNRSQIRSSEKRRHITPRLEFARLAQPFQFAPKIVDNEFRCAIENRLDHGIVLLGLQRTGGINEPPANRKPPQRGLKDADLPRLEIFKIFDFKAPFNLRIARKSVSAGARDVGEDAIEYTREWQHASICRKDMYVRQSTEILQQTRAVSMQLRCKHSGARVAPG